MRDKAGQEQWDRIVDAAFALDDADPYFSQSEDADPDDITTISAFSDDEPRDELGRWTVAGGLWEALKADAAMSKRGRDKLTWGAEHENPNGWLGRDGTAVVVDRHWKSASRAMLMSKKPAGTSENELVGEFARATGAVRLNAHDDGKIAIEIHAEPNRRQLGFIRDYIEREHDREGHVELVYDIYKDGRGIANDDVDGYSPRNWNEFIARVRKIWPDAPNVTAYSPDQPRDERGRFGSGGGGGSGIQAPDTPEFKAWFGKSKVVDDQGRPLVVYHGTHGDIREFGTDDGPDRGGLLAFFTTDPKFASNYSEGSHGSILPVFLKIEDPFDFRSKRDIAMAGHFWDETGGITDQMEQRRILMGLNKADSVDDENAPELTKEDFLKVVEQGGWDAIEAPEFVEWLSHLYDGVVTREGGAINYGVFDPAQVKSATGNVGDFDPDDPDISAYREDQPRDEKGRWATEGGGSMPAFQGEPRQPVPVFVKGKVSREPVERPAGNLVEHHGKWRMEAELAKPKGEALSKASKALATLKREEHVDVDRLVRRADEFLGQALSDPAAVRNGRTWYRDRYEEQHAEATMLSEWQRSHRSESGPFPPGHVTQSMIAGITAALSPQFAWDLDLKSGEHRELNWRTARELAETLVKDLPVSITAEWAQDRYDATMVSVKQSKSENAKPVDARHYPTAPVGMESTFPRAKDGNGYDWVEGTKNGIRPSSWTPEQIKDLLPTIKFRPPSADGMLNAIAIARGGRFDEVVSPDVAPKVRSFYNNFLYPEQPGAVTVDVHMIRALLNEPDLDNGSKRAQRMARKYGYAIFQAAVEHAAAKYHVMPHEAQAMMWYAWRDRNKGKVDDTPDLAASTDELRLPLTSIDEGPTDALPMSEADFHAYLDREAALYDLVERDPLAFWPQGGGRLPGQPIRSTVQHPEGEGIEGRGLTNGQDDSTSRLAGPRRRADDHRDP